MAGNSSNSSSNTGRMAVPEAKEAMKRFKEEVASELGVPLKDGYNGDLTSKQAGSIGGEMVKKMIMKQEEQLKEDLITGHAKARRSICFFGLLFYFR